MQSEGMILGFGLALLLVAAGALLYLLYGLNGKQTAIVVHLAMIERCNADSYKILCKIVEQAQVFRSLAITLGGSITSMNQTTEAIRGLSGLLVTPQPGQNPPEEPPAMWMRGAPPLPNPLFDQFAKPEEAGYLEQTDEDLAEIERQNTLREQGIETDPLRIPQPDPSKINTTNT